MGNALGAVAEMPVMAVVGKKMEGVEVYESGRMQKKVLEVLRVFAVGKEGQAVG